MLLKSPRSLLPPGLLVAWGTTSVPAAAAARIRPTSPRGKQLFTQSCGACHILQNANTKGVQGPNLDLAFKQSVADGLGRSTIAGVVREPDRPPPWATRCPPTSYKGQDARGRQRIRGERDRQASPRAASASARRDSAKADAKNVVEIPTDASGQLAYQVKSATAKAGRSRSARRTMRRSRTTSRSRATVEGPVVQGGKTSEVSDNPEGRQV